MPKTPALQRRTEERAEAREGATGDRHNALRDRMMRRGDAGERRAERANHVHHTSRCSQQAAEQADAIAIPFLFLPPAPDPHRTGSAAPPFSRRPRRPSAPPLPPPPLAHSRTHALTRTRALPRATAVDVVLSHIFMVRTRGLR